jgi:glutamyl-tRNA synthetase/glutamyl-Q tRNA(Asp) synthetase
LSELLRLGEEPRLNAALLRERFASAPPVTRFAPSVTGALHLGHVVNACWTWGLSRALGGRVLLRLEDHDRGRDRREHGDAILDGLDWLGLVADEPSTDAFRAGGTGYRQSDHPERYSAALERLRESRRVYACDCSRKAILARTGAEPGSELRYDGHCRERGLPETPESRIRVELLDGEVAFDDVLAGKQSQRPVEQCGDLLVRGADGCWTYQFCVAVDDFEEGVDLIVRGVDLLSSTGRQVLLASDLGREAPALFAHHPLIGREEGRKLSKSGGDACVFALRSAGHGPAELIGRAAWLSGMLDDYEPVPPDRLGELASALIDES